MSENANIRIIQAATPAEIEIAKGLFQEYAAWLIKDPARPLAAAELSSQKFDDELGSLPGDYTPPDGRLLLALCGDQPAGCVALHKFGVDSCEMKRMWVRPAFRNLGVGRQLAEEIIAQAQRIGYKRILLDSLPSLERALSLYRTLGFQEIAPYRNSADPGSVFMQLDFKAG